MTAPTTTPSRFRTRRAAAILRAGGLVCHPTAGVWGLACDPNNAQAVQKLLATKARPMAKGLILVAASAEHLLPYIQAEPQAWQRAVATWPGPHTWLLPARPTTPRWITGRHSTIAVRVTAHPTAAALCQAFGGAIVSTSANLSRHPAALHGWQARQHLRHHVDWFLGGQLTRPGQPSSITDAQTGRIIRGGSA